MLIATYSCYTMTWNFKITHVIQVFCHNSSFQLVFFFIKWLSFGVLTEHSVRKTRNIDTTFHVIVNIDLVSVLMLMWVNLLLKTSNSFGWCGSVDWAPAWEPKEGSLVQFSVRADARVVGQVLSRGPVRGNHTLMFLFLSFFFPSPL